MSKLPVISGKELVNALEKAATFVFTVNMNPKKLKKQKIVKSLRI
jgi:predicted RNA binding protein YcfA (HicA-like mRNA interferase family)